MRNFFRLARFAWAYRVRFFISVACAMMVALLWGANIGAVYPLLNILFNNQNCQNWIDQKLETGQTQLETIGARIAEIDAIRDGLAAGPEAARTVLNERQARAQADRDAKQSARDEARKAVLRNQLEDRDPNAESPLKATQTLRQRELDIADARSGELEQAARWLLANQEHQLAKRRISLETELSSAQFRQTNYGRLKPLIERFMPRDGFGTLVLLLTVVLISVAIKGVFIFFQEWLVASLAQLTMFRIRNVFFRRTMALDMGQLGDHGAADLMSRFTADTESVGQGMSILLGKVIREPLRALACLGMAMWLNWRLTLLAMILVPATAFATKYAGRAMKRATRKSLESMSRIFKILQETLQGIKVVKAYTMEPAERLRFYRETKNLYKKSVKVAKVDAMSDPVLEMLSLSVACLALLSGAYLVLRQTLYLDFGLFRLQLASEYMGIEDLLSLYAMLSGVSDPVRKLANVHAKIQRASAAADRICALMDRTPQVKDKPDAIVPPRHRKSIEFDQVVFGYSPTAAPVLNNLSFSVRCGERIALVGPNGCGKTTLMSLLPRFFDVGTGAIRVDGVDIRDMRMRELRKQIGQVTQETTLFEGTIADNIAYGTANATRAEIEAAAKQAYAHPFIAALPNGYDTIVQERGLSLSGGQRQRIALARVILRDPAILILDEATSAIDIESATLIRKALEQYSRDRTTFIIAHSLSAIQFADRIVLINNGKVEAIGTDAELRKNSPFYRRLHEIYFQRETA